MIVATAGHVDHGKTLLVKALTGVDTDRLPEEKKRGLTIDLGFAYHDLGNGELTGFVDVPGHEKFIRTMLAGVSGIDFVVFVVAADDGTMPQTAEHLAIMNQLDIRHGVVALTKIDRVSASRVTEVSAEITRVLANTCLRDAPIVPLSAMTGEGVDTLRETICAAARALPPRSIEGNFRLAVDRSFLLAGAGRVVTGTVFSGQAKVGDQLLLAPAGAELRVREIHAQNRSSGTASAGQRCALNVVGSDLRRAEIHRGDWVLASAACFGVSRFDARIQVLAGEERPLKNRTPVHVHVGALDVTGRIVTLQGSEIGPGEQGLVQIQLERVISAVRGDKLILRDQSALRTVGGGVVLDPLPLTRGRSRELQLNYIRAMDSASASISLSQVLNHLDSVPLDRFSQAWNLTSEEAHSLWPEVDMVVVDDGRSAIGITNKRWDELKTIALAGLKAWHERFPDRVGVNENELRVSLPERITQATFDAVMLALLEEQQLVRDAGVVRLPEHGAVRSDADQALWDKVSKVLVEGGIRPPVVHDMTESVGVPFAVLSKFLGKAAKDGQLIKVSDKRYFMPSAVRELIQIVENLVAANPNGQFSVKDYRDKAGIGRNSVIELLEYFDRVGYTLRIDQVRRIRKPAKDAFGNLMN
ncbi:MAG: selenocysteine-specific translation elongation factor [Proteobacteria bacterium]|nr:selenocysteine-specific translation elongation factor [Pseudomonadota bacterium]